MLINGVYGWAIREGFLEEVSLRRGLKEDCGERLTPGRPTTSMSFSAAIREGRGDGGVAWGPQCLAPGGLQRLESVDPPGLGLGLALCRAAWGLQPRPGPLGGSSLMTWLPQGSKMCP